MLLCARIVTVVATVEVLSNVASVQFSSICATPRRRSITESGRLPVRVAIAWSSSPHGVSSSLGLRRQRTGEQVGIELASQAALARPGQDHMAGRRELVAEPRIVEEQRDLAIGLTARRTAEQKIGQIGAGGLLDRAAERGFCCSVSRARSAPAVRMIRELVPRTWVNTRSAAAATPASSSRRLRLLTCMPGSSHSAAKTGAMLLVAHMTMSAPDTACRALATGMISMPSLFCISRAKASRRSAHGCSSGRVRCS